MMGWSRPDRTIGFNKHRFGYVCGESGNDFCIVKKKQI
jgi:hypothetical protein